MLDVKIKSQNPRSEIQETRTKKHETRTKAKEARAEKQEPRVEIGFGRNWLEAGNSVGLL